LTTNKKYAIINISKEREVKDMRKISYEVNGVKVASYARARELQPTGALKEVLEEVITPTKVDMEAVRKRNEFFAKKRAKRAAMAN
jgi:CRISPR/Cas system CSM-associated protein Csm2 small subunit